MEIVLPIINKDGEPIDKVILDYEYSKYTNGFSLNVVKDLTGNFVCVHTCMSGNGISTEKNMLGVGVSATCCSIEVGGQRVYIPKYLSFNAASVHGLEGK